MAVHRPCPAAVVDTNSSSKRDVRSRKGPGENPEDRHQAERAKPKGRAEHAAEAGGRKGGEDNGHGALGLSQYTSPYPSCFIFYKNQRSPLPLNRVSRCTTCSMWGDHGAVSWSLRGGTVEGVNPPASMHRLSYSCRNRLAPSSTHPYYQGVMSP